MEERALTRVRIVCLSLIVLLGSSFALSAQMTREQQREMSAKYPPLPRPSNLKVLPADIAIPDLVETMVRFSEGLGVQCTHCHAFAPDHKELDFKSDANPNKDKARIMLRMVTDINGKYLADLGSPRKTGPVGCGTCHQGQQVPPSYKPPAGYVLE
jgi:hypothetical protein